MFKDWIKRKNKNNRFADNHTLDDFYLGFENKFRGSEDEISKKMEFYAELFKRTPLEFSKYPVVDIGCGRGELLSILKRYSIRAIGLDLNKAMVKRAKQQGLEARQGDAVTFFEKQYPGSIGAVIGVHIIEHIPFDELLTMFKHVYTSLTEGGVAVFETPNAENISVGSYTFYMDPSHLKPIPHELARYAFEAVGFKDIEVLFLHEANKDRTHYEDPMLEELSNRLYGPRDYAIVGYKR